ncbi:MAG: PilZ domain-containing protein [Pirellulales bacterium]|nr:PilZ domain-containing protein [Planctomycetales bacterium]
MFDFTVGDETIEAADSIAALAQLEQNREGSDGYRRLHERVTTRVKVTIQPANSSDRRRLSIQGVTADVSRGGCRVLFSAPIGVGDVYWMSLDRESLQIDPLFARCVRCRMVREDAFEAGFSFFTEIDIDAAATAPDVGLV